MLFALYAAAKQHERETERWNTLYELLADHGEALAETIANAHSR